jgi:uncharacterized phosphosugar-binding protein
MSLSDKWITAIYDIINRIKTTQTENIENAAEAISNSIISNHVCFLFGSGHSIMPVIEMYPRYGGLVGFMPILELPLSYFTRIIGDLGFPQFDFLENSEGYGRRIMENYNIHKEDSMIIFSNSGSPPVIIDVALSFKEKGGGKLIGVTSLAHSRRAKSRHSCGKKLYELADIVVDNCTPAGDVVASTGLQKAGPTSTIGSVAIANLIALKTIERLSKKGYTPLMNPVRGYDPKADETMKTILNEYSKRLLNHISQKF